MFGGKRFGRKRFGGIRFGGADATDCTAASPVVALLRAHFRAKALSAGASVRFLTEAEGASGSEGTAPLGIAPVFVVETCVLGTTLLNGRWPWQIASHAPTSPTETTNTAIRCNITNVRFTTSGAWPAQTAYFLAAAPESGATYTLKVASYVPFV